MSEWTLCNRCTLQLMKAQARARGVTVILGKDEHGWVTASYSDHSEPAAYFMELTEGCAC